MKRRALLQRLGATAATSVAWPLGLNAQQRSQPPLVGIFTTTDASGRSLISDETDAFHQAMRDLGYIEGRNVSYVYRSISDQMPSPAEIARSVPEFVRRKPEVIVSPGGVVSVRLLMEATSTIPIVMVTAFDAVENGLVPSLAHPGGNVTGLSTQSTDLSTKRLQLLHETLPLVRRIAVFIDPRTPQRDRVAMDAAGRTLGVELRFVEISTPDTFDSAFDTAANWGAEALSGASGFVSPSPNKEKFLALAARYRLPAIYHQSIIVHAGGLMSYGPNLPDLWRRAATYADKILKGAKPADLPVEQPTKFEFVINLKTAKALSLTVPQSIFARATEVIE
jgi:putative ABC transport system substrate-binding protein